MNVRGTPFHNRRARSWNRRAGKRTASECLLPVMLKDKKDGCCSLPSARVGSRDKLSVLFFSEAGLIQIGQLCDVSNSAIGGIFMAHCNSYAKEIQMRICK